MQFLRANTAVDVLIGPFSDLTDGSSPESGESPSVKLSKNGQTLAAKNDATTPVHDADGYYNCELDTTDTNTLGMLTLTVAASANALPVRHEYMVVAEWWYDLHIEGDGVVYGTAQAGAAGSITLPTSASATEDYYNGQTAVILGGTGAGQSRQIVDYSTGRVASVEPNWATNPDGTSVVLVVQTAPAPDASLASVNVTQISGDSTAADNLEADYDGTGYNKANSTIGTAGDVSATLSVVLEADQAVNVTKISGSATAADNLEASALRVIAGTAATGTLSTTQATTDLSGYADDQLIGRVLIVASGNAEGEATDITDYASSGGTLTFTALTTAMANGDTFVIV